MTDLRKDEAASLARYRWMQRPLRRRVATPIAILLASLSVAIPGRTSEITWLRMMGDKSEATLVDDPRPMPSTGRDGPHFWPLLSVTMPDGQRIEAVPSHPLRIERIPPAESGGTWTSRAPQAGDRVPVRVSGRDPVRITPESALAYKLAPLVEAVVLLVFTSLIYSFLRNLPSAAASGSPGTAGLADRGNRPP
jgi:hypothetical protein